MEGITPEQIIGENGEFVDNWRDVAFPGDENAEIRSNPTLGNLKNIQSMARQVISGESTIGKLSGGRNFAILPNEHSTPEEIEEFHTKLGRPKTAAEYGFDKLEGADPKYAEKMAATLHAAGASKELANALLNAHMEYSKEYAQAIETEDKIADAKADKAIRLRLGSEYDASMQQANLAINALAAPIDAEWAAQLAKEMPYDNNAQQLFAKIGAMISEDPGLKHATGATGFTPSDALTKANEIMANNPYYLTPQPAGKPRNQAEHERVTKEVADLFAIAYPSKT